MLGIESGKVAISIVLVSALWRLREPEQISRPAIVNYIQLYGYGGWKLVERRQEQQRKRSHIPFLDVL